MKSAVVVEAEGIEFILMLLVQGVPWNEILDEVGLEKSDFKGQSAADKIVTLYAELKGHMAKYPKVALAELYTMTIDVVREGWGAI